MATGYDYIPAPAEMTYDDAVAELQQRFSSHRLEPAWLPFAHKPLVDELERALESAGIAVHPFRSTLEELDAYETAAEYAARYPLYHNGNQPEKRLEHFIAMSLLGLDAEDVFIDIAACSSPLPEIARRLYGCVAYGQDIMYAEGIHGDLIGGDACALPTPDGFASAAALTCSLEHFEGDGDTRLFAELARVFRPGGRVVVAPLYLHLFPAALTDPRYALRAEGLSFDPDAVVYCADGWGNRHGRFYSPETLKARILEPHGDVFDFQVLRIAEPLTLGHDDPAIYARFVLQATKR
jgi:SAM-dependent methyltransferase